MTAGLPGTGLGGVFYLLSAFLMPFVEVVNTLRGRSSLRRWRMVAQQFGILVGIVSAFWATGWALKASLKKLSGALVSVSPHLSQAAQGASNFFRLSPVFLSLGALATVIVFLSVANYLLDRRNTARSRLSMGPLGQAVSHGGFQFRRQPGNLRLKPLAASESRAFAQRDDHERQDGSFRGFP
jgi:hypothetical protein